MSATASLFVDTPDVQDLSLTRLSTEAEAWPEEIIQKFKERIPDSAGIQMMVKFTKQDPENGTAVGSIMLNTAGKSAVVPVVVREGMMSPLDILIAEGRTLPLTPDFFMAVFQQNGAFDRVEEFPLTFGGGINGFAGSDPSITNTTYPPSMTRYASDKKAAPDFKSLAQGFHKNAQAIFQRQPSMLDDILPTVSKDQIQDFHLLVEKNASVLVGFDRHKTMPILKKVAAYEAPLWNRAEAQVDSKKFESVRKPFIMIKRTQNPGKYDILANEYGEFSPAIRPVNEAEMKTFLSEIAPQTSDDMIRELDLTGEKVVATQSGHVAKINDLQNAEKLKEKIEECKETGTYAVRTKKGTYVQGMVIPDVVSLSGAKLPYKIFLGKETFSIQGNIMGIPMDKNTTLPEGIDPAAGDTGIFVLSKDGKVTATGPIVIHSLSVDPIGIKTLKGADHDGKSVVIRMNPLMHLEKTTKVQDAYMVPNMMRWIRTGEFTEVSSSKETFHVKLGSLKHLRARLIYTGGEEYALQGLDPYVKKASMDPTRLDRSEAKFLFHSLGMPLRDCDDFIKKAKRYGQTELELSPTPIADGSLTKQARQQAAREKVAKILRRNFLKEAALVESAQTVDALLALNFVNPDNIAKMVAKIPQLKATISGLGDLLLASRLGMAEIPEQSTSTAMMRLLEVTEGLEKLRTSQQTQAETA